MKKIINKLKPVFLLLGLSIVCFSIAWVTKEIKSIFSSEIDYGVAKQLDTSKGLVIAQSTFTDTSVPSKVEEESGYVYAATTESDGTAGMCPASTINIASESVCSKNSSGDVDYTSGSRSGTRVSKSSQVILSQVTVPLELYSGMDVKDSNRQITSETPTFKAAGEQIDERSANTQLPPGTQIDEHKSWVEDKPFTTDYELGFSQQADDPTNEGKIGVDSKLTNNCEYCNNKSNVNPDKSNKMSEFMLDNTYRTPGEKDEVTSSDVIESCNENQDQFIEWNSKYEGCFMSLVEKFVSLIKTIGDAIWNNCTASSEDDDECIYVEDIVIKMASPFGSDKECRDGTCTNAYMNTRNSSALAPSSGSSNKVYYTTRCRAIIEGSEHDVTCAWDMSHLYKERKVSELDDVPTLDSTPTDSEYNEFLLNNVSGQRGSAIQLQ